MGTEKQEKPTRSLDELLSQKTKKERTGNDGDLREKMNRQIAANKIFESTSEEKQDSNLDDLKNEIEKIQIDLDVANKKLNALYELKYDENVVIDKQSNKLSVDFINTISKEKSQETNNKSQEEIDKLKEDLKEAKKNIKTLKDKNTNLLEEKNNLKSSSSDSKKLEKQIAKLEDEKQAKATELQALKKEYNALQKNNQKLEEKINKLKEDQKAKSKEIKQTNNSADNELVISLQAKLDELQNDVNQKQSEISDNKKALAKYKDELIKCKIEIDNNQEELNKKQDELAKKQDELAFAYKTLEEQSNLLAEEEKVIDRQQQILKTKPKYTGEKLQELWDLYDKYTNAKISFEEDFSDVRTYCVYKQELDGLNKKQENLQKDLNLKEENFKNGLEAYDKKYIKTIKANINLVKNRIDYLNKNIKPLLNNKQVNEYSELVKKISELVDLIKNN